MFCEHAPTARTIPAHAGIGCGREKQERLCVGLSDGQGSAGAVMLMRFSDGDVAMDRRKAGRSAVPPLGVLTKIL